MSPQELMKTYGCSRATAWRHAKAGTIPNVEYHKKRYFLASGAVDAELLYKAAHTVFLRVCPVYAHKEDMVQEAVLRCLEVAGKVEGKPEREQVNYFAKVSQNTMRDYLDRMVNHC